MRTHQSLQYLTQLLDLHGILGSQHRVEEFPAKRFFVGFKHPQNRFRVQLIRVNHCF